MGKNLPRDPEAEFAVVGGAVAVESALIAGVRIEGNVARELRCYAPIQFGPASSEIGAEGNWPCCG